MGVGIHCAGHVKVDDVRHAGNINPARSNIGRDENIELAFLEASDRFLTLVLRHVALQRHRPILFTF